MGCIIICDTAADTLIKYNIKNENVKKLKLKAGEQHFGPHSLTLHNGKLLVANTYNNTASIIDCDKFIEMDNIYIGPYPTDIRYYYDKFYVVCGDGDCVVQYDIMKKNIEFEIPVGSFPHNMEIDFNRKRGFISNIGENTISVLDCIKNGVIKTIKLKNVPVKSETSEDKKYLYVVVSNLGYGIRGKISIINMQSLQVEKEVTVGNGPVDICEDEKRIFISNLCDNSVSIVNKNTLIEEKRYIIDGMPKSILKIDNYLYVADYLYGKLNIIDIRDGNKKVIAIGNEPNDMIFTLS